MSNNLLEVNEQTINETEERIEQQREAVLAALNETGGGNFPKADTIVTAAIELAWIWRHLLGAQFGDQSYSEGVKIRELYRNVMHHVFVKTNAGDQEAVSTAIDLATKIRTWWAILSKQGEPARLQEVEQFDEG